LRHYFENIDEIEYDSCSRSIATRDIARLLAETLERQNKMFDAELFLSIAIKDSEITWRDD